MARFITKRSKSGSGGGRRTLQAVMFLRCRSETPCKATGRDVHAVGPPLFGEAVCRGNGRRDLRLANLERSRVSAVPPHHGHHGFWPGVEREPLRRRHPQYPSPAMTEAARTGDHPCCSCCCSAIIMQSSRAAPARAMVAHSAQRAARSSMSCAFRAAGET